MTQISQRRLEVFVALGFSAALLGLSVFEETYIRFSPYHAIDLGMVLAIFAFMIAGPRIGVPVAAAWATIFYLTHSHLSPYGFWSILIVKVGTAYAAWYAYQTAKKVWPGSRFNVYWGVLGAGIFRFVTSGIIVSLVHETNIFLMSDTYIELLLELSLCMVAMSMIVGKLRQIHILNGIKRREK